LWLRVGLAIGDAATTIEMTTDQRPQNDSLAAACHQTDMIR
jgi:hypothetical protein